MKAAIYNGIKNVELRDLEMPACGDNDVIIKNIYAGICGTDVNAYNHGGEDVMIYEGFEFGHEMISEIYIKGKNVNDVEVGQQVFPIPSQMKKEGIMRSSTVGAFSEYIKVDDFELGKSAVFVPDEITDRQAVLIEPFLIGCNAIRPLEVEKNKKAIVFGAGTIGMAAGIALKYLGCEVIICDIIDSRLKIASKLGFHTCNTMTENYLEKCKSILGLANSFFGEAIDADYYVDAAGNQAIIDLFYQGAKSGCKLSVVAVHHKPVSMNLVPLTYGGYQIVGPNGSYLDNIPLTLDILKSQKFDVEEIITSEFNHSQIIEAFEKSSNADESLKVILKY